MLTLNSRSKQPKSKQHALFLSLPLLLLLLLLFRLFLLLLDFLGRARRQNQDWAYDNDAVISNLLAEGGLLREAYANRPTDDNKAVYYRRRQRPSASSGAQC
nr:unnamed protein product [Spirometra erinaceieuropaei]